MPTLESKNRCFPAEKNWDCATRKLVKLKIMLIDFFSWNLHQM